LQPGAPSAPGAAGGTYRDLLCAPGGLPWRFLPDSFSLWRTVYRWFGALRDAGGFEDLNHCNCRLAKEFEQTIRSATAFLYAASAMMLIRRLARYA